MNFKNSDRKHLKGFTLVELIVVIAIITILAGIISVSVFGMQRDARIESNNYKAQMVFSAFQDVLIDCEIKQDLSMFDVREYDGAYGDIRGAVIFFRISDTSQTGAKNVNSSTGMGDEMHFMTVYSKPVPHQFIPGVPNLASGSIWVHGTTQNVSSYGGGYNNFSSDGDGGSTLWNKWNTAIAGRIDKSMEGTYVVMIDTENYEVRSVICRELINGQDPKTGLYDAGEVGPNGINIAQFAQQADNNVTLLDGSVATLPCRMFFIKNKDSLNKAAKAGAYVGCYPYMEDAYLAVS